MINFKEFLKEEKESDGDMALTQLRMIEMCCSELQKILTPKTDLEPWVQDKLSVATDYMTTVLDYLKFSQ